MTDSREKDHEPRRDRFLSPRQAGLLHKVRIPLVIALIVAAFVVGLKIGRQTSNVSTAVPGSHDQGRGDSSAEVWTCSMHPQIRSDEPGQCPICGMDLIPVSDEGIQEREDGEGRENRITLTKRARALARIRTAAVRRAEAGAVELRLLGRLDYDERRVRTIASWTAGRIDRLHVAVTGQRIGRGQVIATLYSPEIYTAQQDLIQAARQVERLSDGTSSAQIAAKAALVATRERLKLLGVSETELLRMEHAKSPFRHVPIHASIGGTVIERLVDEGAYVNQGTGIYRVADLSKLWVQLDAYERDLALISKGQVVKLTISAFPEELFDGRVAFIDPVLSSATRTSKVRVEVSNGDGRLQPGMFAEALVEGSEESGGLRQLVIPESAPLFTGRRSVVYVEIPDTEQPTYEARQVRLGHKTGENYPVVAGLQEGERVVVQGAFILDADLQIRGGHSMMAQPDDNEPGDLDRIVVANPRFLSSLSPVVGAYINVQERLAEDDHEAATVAARALQREVEQLPAPSTSTAREAWQPISNGLSQQAEQIAAAENIAAARVAFEHLSTQMRALLERFGNPLSTPLRVAYCSMAFENRGAEWVQRGLEIDNSYFGAVMRRCGSIRSTLGPGEHLGHLDGS